MKTKLAITIIIALGLSGCENFSTEDAIRSANEGMRLYRAAKGLPPLPPATLTPHETYPVTQ